MSDSINEQRCEQHGQPIGHVIIHSDGVRDDVYDGRCTGPSVVTPPAQDEHRSRAINEARVGDRVEAVLKGTLIAYDSDLGKWTLETDGTDHISWQVELHWAQPFTIVPAAPSVSTDHTDERRCSKDGNTFDEHYEAGLREGRAELAELREAISDTSQYGGFDGADWLRGYDYRRRELGRG